MTHDEHMARLRECVEAGNKATQGIMIAAGMTVRLPERGNAQWPVANTSGPSDRLATCSASKARRGDTRRANAAFFAATANARPSLAYALARLEKLEAVLQAFSEKVRIQLDITSADSVMSSGFGDSVAADAQRNRTKKLEVADSRLLCALAALENKDA